MKLGRFIVDTHVHSQRHAAGAALKGSRDFAALSKAMPDIEAYDNSARLLYDMEAYGVDMCVLQPALTFGMSNEVNVEQMKKYPDKFVCNCQAWTKHTRDKAKAEGTKWSIESVCEELEALLKTGNYVGIGEGIRYMDPTDPRGPYTIHYDEREVVKNMMKVCDVARSYKVPIRYHSGVPGGYAFSYHGFSSTYNPLWAHDLAIAFPDLTIIMEHAGIEGGWWEHFYDACLHVAAGHKNVYLETGRYWTELYYKPLSDPNIGPEKLLWGTDWGASLPIHTNLGGKYLPQTYTRQNFREGIPAQQVDIWGWSLKQLSRVDISQDDLNLILGGNAVRVYNLRMPGGLTRMFKFVD